ncbi:hypothetical protein GCM10027053_01160 [Intrasporangium mesophilum]
MPIDREQVPVDVDVTDGLEEGITHPFVEVVNVVSVGAQRIHNQVGVVDRFEYRLEVGRVEVVEQLVGFTVQLRLVAESGVPESRPEVNGTTVPEEEGRPRLLGQRVPVEESRVDGGGVLGGLCQSQVDARGGEQQPPLGQGDERGRRVLTTTRFAVSGTPSTRPPDGRRRQARAIKKEVRSAVTDRGSHWWTCWASVPPVPPDPV